MRHRFVKFLFGAAAALTCGFVTIPLHAQSDDQEALDIRRDAMEVSYLAMKFDEVVSKLEDAIVLCDRGECQPQTVARLHCDLGLVYIAGLNRIGDGRAEFVTALTTDPEVTLDAELASGEVRTAFNDVKTSLGGSADTLDDEADASADEVADGTTPQVAIPESGELLHIPPAEQLLLTPLPIYAEVASGVELTRIRVHYQTPRGREWLTAELKPMGTGFGLEIDCTDVGSTPGEFRYFLEGLKGDEVVAYSGSAEVPHRVEITAQLSGGPPALPGEAPPPQCETEECIPGMIIPGCPMPAGGDCQVNEDCERNLVCVDQVCRDRPTRRKPRSHWLSVAFQQDFMLFPAEQDVCSGGNDYSCFFAGEVEYLGIPDQGQGNEITGGFGPATQRVLIGYDYLTPFGLALGVQGGFAFNGGPESHGGSFLPVHVEGRVAYYHRTRWLEPYAVLAGGMAQVDGRVTVSIIQTESDIEIYEGADQYRIEESSDVDAWRRAGTGFVALGGGLRFLVEERVGPFIEARAAQSFPASSTLVGLRLGLSLGF